MTPLKKPKKSEEIYDLCIEFSGVPMPVSLGFNSNGATMYETRAMQMGDRAWYGNHRTVIDDSRIVHRIASELVRARPSYSSLMKVGLNKRLIDSGKIPPEYMRAAIKKFDWHIWCGNYWHPNNIWAEFMDILPEKRGHKLPAGKDLALYRGDGVRVRRKMIEWDDSERQSINPNIIDVRSAKPVFLSSTVGYIRNKERDPATVNEKLDYLLHGRKPTYRHIELTEEWENALGVTPETRTTPSDFPLSELNLADNLFRIDIAGLKKRWIRRKNAYMGWNGITVLEWKFKWNFRADYEEFSKCPGSVGLYWTRSDYNDDAHMALLGSTLSSEEIVERMHPEKEQTPLSPQQKKDLDETMSYIAPLIER
jgi:hypothetical protein